MVENHLRGTAYNDQCLNGFDPFEFDLGRKANVNANATNIDTMCVET